MRHRAVLGLCAALLAASATLAPAAPSSDAGTGDALRLAVSSPDRTPAFVARDSARHPYEELSFIGVTPQSAVVEIWPGGGYWTEILAPLLHDRGVYYAALAAPEGGRVQAHFATLPPAMQAKFTARPDLYGRVKLTRLTGGRDEIAPAGSADLVLTFRNLHNWMAEGDAPEMLAAIRRALKPGGVLGIEDHRSRTGLPQDPKAKNGYIRQDYAVALIERAGFKLIATSELEANPKDGTDWPKGVWTLPPTLALGEVDRAKYMAIGEADNFLLKFRKVGS